MAFVRRHWPGLCVALVLTAAFAGPRWYLLATEPPDGARIQASPWAASDIGYDLTEYAVAIRDAYDGSPGITSAYDLSSDDVTEPGTPWLDGIGALGRLTGSPYSALAIVATVLALATFLLLYAMALELTGDRLLAAALVPIVTMLVGVIVQAGGILPLRHSDVLRPVLSVDPQRELHTWYRFLPPAVPLPLFFGAAIATPRATEHGGKMWTVTAIVAVALVIYTYAFYWSALAVAMACWAAWLAYRREWHALRRLVIVGAGAALLASPELAARIHASLSLSSDVNDRLGKEPSGIITSQFVAVAQRFAIGVPFLLPLLRGPERNRFYIALFTVPLPLALVDGFVPQPDHYLTQVWHVFAIPAFVAGAGELAVMLPRRNVRAAAWTTGVLAVMALAYVVGFQVRGTDQTEAAYAMPSDERSAFDWIESHVSEGDVVVSPSINTNMLLPALTPADRYLEDGLSSEAPDDEIIDRFLRAQAAFGYSEEDVFARLDPANGYPTTDQDVPEDQLERHFEESAAYFSFHWQITHPERIAERLPEWREEYETLLRSENVLGRYRADYVYCGHRERFWPAASPGAGPFVTVAFQQGEATVYRIVSASDTGAKRFAGC